MTSRAVFLDRDGTLIQNDGPLADPDQIQLMPGAPAALKRLQDARFLLFIVTNQPWIDRGVVTWEQTHAVHARLAELFAAEGVQFTQIYTAPEATDHGAYGRKPSPQFLFDAAKTHGLDLLRCYMVGDKAKDVHCGLRASVRCALLVLTGHGPEAVRDVQDRAVIVPDLQHAADFILANYQVPTALHTPYDV